MLPCWTTQQREHYCSTNTELVLTDRCQERDIPVAPPRSEEREEASDRGRSIHEYFNDPVNKRVKSASRANRGKYSNSAEIC